MAARAVTSAVCAGKLVNHHQNITIMVFCNRQRAQEIQMYSFHWHSCMELGHVTSSMSCRFFIPITYCTGGNLILNIQRH